ncbi:hypothetical protein I7I51_02043 [Histoplasma capsulatum]|uniref:Uncharacterized protein n=2 Tax=Histoplasma TaxID=5036 RepID=A0A8A1MGE5_AJECA|nr:hypothetical protein I7I51_02043 [Histoplasma capsulatum]
MASTEAEPRSTIVINDDTDAETDAPRSPPRELRRKRRLVDYSLPEYEALFDGPALLNSSASTTLQPLEKRTMPNLKVVLQWVKTYPGSRYFHERDLQEEVQRLKKWNTELEIKHRAELIGNNEEIRRLKAEVIELEHRCQCPICYTIPSEWKTLLCGHRVLSRVSLS